MHPNDPELDRLLFRLLNPYGDERPAMADAAAAADDVLQVLRAHAAGLLAEPGRFQALLTLALTLAKEDVPLLGGVEGEWTKLGEATRPTPLSRRSRSARRKRGTSTGRLQ